MQQPQSVPLQLLAETGIVGAVLAITAYLLLLRSAAGTVRRRPPGSERLLAGALLAGAVAYAVHCLYDWDWNIPAVRLPVLVLGVLIGARSARSRWGRGAGLGGRLLFVAALTVWLCAFALSARSRASRPARPARPWSGLEHRAGGSPERPAQRRPGQFAGSAVRCRPAGRGHDRAASRGRAPARGDLLDAVGRDPTDAQAWDQLRSVYVLLGDTPDARIAARRVIALDPRGAVAASLEMRGYAP